MSLFTRTTPVLVLLAAALVVGASGGAVAGAMITGAQIKNNTVTTSDIKNGSLSAKDLSSAARTSLKGKTGPQGPAGLAGLEVVESGTLLGSGEDGYASAACPAGKRPISVTGDWLGGNQPTGTRLGETLGGSGYAYGINTSVANDTLRVQVLCASVS